MSRENVEIVRRAAEAQRSEGLEDRVEEFLSLWDPDCEYVSIRSAVDAETYHGHDGIRRYLKDLAEAWAEWRLEVVEVRELGPDKVLATGRFHAVGKDSGVPLELQAGAIFELSSGKLLRGHSYPSRADALEASGVAE